jgi:hypothetical protein
MYTPLLVKVVVAIAIRFLLALDFDLVANLVADRDSLLGSFEPWPDALDIHHSACSGNSNRLYGALPCSCLCMPAGSMPRT